MSELRNILKEEYIRQINQLDLKKLLEMVEDVMSQPVVDINEEVEIPAALQKDGDTDTLEMILKMIPDIEVSEIGWSDVKTPENDAEIKGPQRQLLEGYLGNIKGNDFASRIVSVSEFYKNGSTMVSRQAGNDRTKRIVQAISYLVFYKTLTKVITNFNASSAGFSFESFLSALVNGFQIPANTGTIADYVDRASGQEIPVSLKLYREGGLEVGGSYTDLINDLVDPKYPGSIDGGMRYVVCTKQLTGEDLEQEGRIDFYQFDFNVENVFDILANSKDKSQQCIMLPRQVVSALLGGQRSGVDINKSLPGQQNLPGDEELEKLFISTLDQLIKDNEIVLSQQQGESLVQALDYAKKDDIFRDYVAKKGDVERNMGIVRGRSLLDRDIIKKILNDFDWYSQVKTANGRSARQMLLNAIGKANGAVITRLRKSRLADERRAEISRMVSEGEFLDPQESARQYNMMGREQKRIALRNSWGYLTTGHFSLNQKQATAEGPPTNTKFVGSIMIGRAMVGNVVNSIRDILNDEVTEIFQSLKILSDSLNTFFAGGLEDDGLAKAATDNANNISSKEILKTNK
jgi:hypothetical protein